MKEKNTKPFTYYNSYYDLLYHNKDYEQEACYVANIIKLITPNAQNLLELGCGTGNYSSHLTKQGFNITGIEISEEMAGIARSKQIEGFNVSTQNIIDFELGKQFDGAVALFHVVSYLTNTHQLLNCFKQVHKHLTTGSSFIFDVWYTPAVYTITPQSKIKHVEQDGVTIKRLAKPEVNYEENTVSVNYEMTIDDVRNNNHEVLNEVHTLRHFTTPEIILLAELSGFQFIRSEEFLTAKTPGSNTWGVCYILQKNG